MEGVALRSCSVDSGVHTRFSVECVQWDLPWGVTVQGHVAAQSGMALNINLVLLMTRGLANWEAWLVMVVLAVAEL